MDSDLVVLCDSLLVAVWFLSSVCISGGAALYQTAQHRYEDRLNTQKELLTCEFEIANRLNGMKFLLLRAKKNADAQAGLIAVSKMQTQRLHLMKQTDKG